MKDYTEEEKNLIKSLNRPIDNINETLVSSIVDKLLDNKDFEELIHYFNSLYDFAEVPKNIVDKLILENNKECIAEFLENEDSLYFLNKSEINRLKNFLNVPEINIRLEKDYDYYYNFLYNQGIRNWQSDTIKINDDTIEHVLTRYDKLIRLKLKEVKNIGVVVACTIYSNYYLSEEEQILKGIDYINEFGFNIERNINNKNIIKNLWTAKWIISFDSSFFEIYR